MVGIASALGPLGKFGASAGLLYNAFASFSGEEGSGFGLDNIRGFAETFGIDPEWLQEGGTLSNILEGREGPLSMLLGAMFSPILPKPVKNIGMAAAIVWAIASFLKDEKGNNLIAQFTGASNDDNKVFRLSPEQLKELAIGNVERLQTAPDENIILADANGVGGGLDGTLPVTDPNPDDPTKDLE